MQRSSRVPPSLTPASSRCWNPEGGGEGEERPSGFAIAALCKGTYSYSILAAILAVYHSIQATILAIYHSIQAAILARYYSIQAAILARYYSIQAAILTIYIVY